MGLDSLIAEYPQITIKFAELPKGLSGLYFDNIIFLNKRLNSIEKHCVLAEEIGHHETTYGNITDLDEVRSRKLEIVARRWGYEKLVPLDKLIECHENEHWLTDDICFYLDITPKYLQEALNYYTQKYGISKNHNGYSISFDSLNIKKL